MNTHQDKTHAAGRRQHSAQDKVKLLRLHLLEGKPISEICDEHGISPSNFYQWQKTFFENGATAFDRAPRNRRMDEGELRIAQLEAKLKRKEEVITMITEDLVRTKKELGEV